ncbi:MAG: hypothetical protein F4Y01_10280 [Gammaproteobacteria bacterium]|nr:hypothetical protein [Gammaproteobacteria bacterium]
MDDIKARLDSFEGADERQFSVSRNVDGTVYSADPDIQKGIEEALDSIGTQGQNRYADEVKWQLPKPDPRDAMDMSGGYNALPLPPRDGVEIVDNAPPLPPRDVADVAGVADNAPPLPPRDVADVADVADNAPPSVQALDDAPPLPPRDDAPPLPPRDANTQDPGWIYGDIDGLDDVADAGSGGRPPPMPPRDDNIMYGADLRQLDDAFSDDYKRAFKVEWNPGFDNVQTSNTSWIYSDDALSYVDDLDLSSGAVGTGSGQELATGTANAEEAAALVDNVPGATGTTTSSTTPVLQGQELDVPGVDQHFATTPGGDYVPLTTADVNAPPTENIQAVTGNVVDAGPAPAGSADGNPATHVLDAMEGDSGARANFSETTVNYTEVEFVQGPPPQTREEYGEVAYAKLQFNDDGTTTIVDAPPPLPPKASKAVIKKGKKAVDRDILGNALLREDGVGEIGEIPRYTQPGGSQRGAVRGSPEYDYYQQEYMLNSSLDDQGRLFGSPYDLRKTHPDLEEAYKAGRVTDADLQRIMDAANQRAVSMPGGDPLSLTGIWEDVPISKMDDSLHEDIALVSNKVSQGSVVNTPDAAQDLDDVVSSKFDNLAGMRGTGIDDSGDFEDVSAWIGAPDFDDPKNWVGAPDFDDPKNWITAQPDDAGNLSRTRTRSVSSVRGADNSFSPRQTWQQDQMVYLDSEVQLLDYQLENLKNSSAYKSGNPGARDMATYLETSMDARLMAMEEVAAGRDPMTALQQRVDQLTLLHGVDDPRVLAYSDTLALLDDPATMLVAPPSVADVEELTSSWQTLSEEISMRAGEQPNVERAAWWQQMSHKINAAQQKVQYGLDPRPELWDFARDVEVHTFLDGATGEAESTMISTLIQQYDSVFVNKPAFVPPA